MKILQAANGKSCVLFWHEDEENGCFSNWYNSPFTVDHIRYCHVEQYIMAEKARVFFDAERFTQIMEATSPRECKRLGKLVSGYKDSLWDQHRLRVLLTGLRAKFRQNEDLKQELLATGKALLAEASPYDSIYGIGMDADHALKTLPLDWPGQNLLGNALMVVRAELKMIED